MNSPIYRQVAKPVRILYVSQRLFGIELVLGVIAAFLVGSPLGAMFAWLVSHPVCIVISIREPHIDAVIDALRDRRATSNHWPTEDRSYVP